MFDDTNYLSDENYNDYSHIKNLLYDIFRENKIVFDDDLVETLLIPENVALVLHSIHNEFPYSQNDTLTKEQLYEEIENTFGYSMENETEYEEEYDEESVDSILKLIDHILIFPKTKKYRETAKKNLDEIINASNNTFSSAKTKIKALENPNSKIHRSSSRPFGKPTSF